ncbi:reverse transcriptase domain-containing protein [Tanacetum coccineum]
MKESAIALTRWIEKMENVIDNSGCAENQKVNYVASSFVNKALTWWNTQVQARGREAAIGMSWTDFKALLVEEFCPSNEIEKLESEFWNHKICSTHPLGGEDGVGNTQVQARGREAAIGMSWNDFKVLLVEEFCLSSEMEKLENEFWNHTMVRANHVTYTNRFHKLAKLVPHLVTLESSRIKR